MQWKNILIDRLLKEGHLAGNEVLFKRLLKKALIDREKLSANESKQMAREIASLLDLPALHELPRSSDYVSILLSVNEFANLPEDSSADAAWGEISRLVNKLPNSAREKLQDNLSKVRTLSDNEVFIKAYLKEEIARRASHPALERDIAYDIAALIGEFSAMKVPRNSPYMKIAFMAGELELPEYHRDPSATWDNLISLIRQLP